MICPQCAAEYREDFTSCSTCQVPLIPGTKPNEFTEQGGTPAVLVGVTIGVAMAIFFAVRMLHGSWRWYVGFVGLAIIVYFIRRRYRV